MFIGVMIWCGARDPVRLAEEQPDERARSWLRSFWVALATQMSNPKAAGVYASVFIFAAAALVLSAPAPRATYLRSKPWIDRGAGAVMTLLGLRLILGPK